MNLGGLIDMKKKVLCVEDNLTNLEIITTILEKMDYEVVVAHEGKSAVTMAKNTLPDVILMDLHLPGMDGVEATYLIKSNPELAHIPVVAITADIYARQDFMDAGGNAYITKPIRSGSLLRTLQQVLGSQQA
jgi:two-component system, cell cycle response regulator DivK